jgi:hypothetical protein
MFLVGGRSELLVENEDQQPDAGVDPEEDGECDFHGVGGEVVPALLDLSGRKP